MSYVVKKIADCAECGKPTNRRERNTTRPLCLACAVDKANAAVLQMRLKTGPHYEKWRDAMARTFAK